MLLAFAATPWVQGAYSRNYEYYNLDNKGPSIRDKTAEQIVSQVYQDLNASPSAPSVYSAHIAGGFPNLPAYITQNGWIEIIGAGLAPASVGPNGLTWVGTPELAAGTLPAQLGGVSVTVNGMPAFVYYVSATQVNVLTPLDSTVGFVKLVVTNGGVSSAPFSVYVSPAAPSFLHIGASNYILATHADYTLVGPASLSVAGYPVSPAKPGETITLWGVGFGLPSNGVINGSSSQSGMLPGRPSITIGGGGAGVTFAGLDGPGLYQINVTVPATAATGDDAVTCSWNGWAGVVEEGSITVQP